MLTSSIATRPFETSITLSLEHVSVELSRAHRELSPERIPEQIPFSITLLYPWLPAAVLREEELRRLSAFFAERPPLEFALTRVTEFPGVVAYAVPEPDDNCARRCARSGPCTRSVHPTAAPGSEPPPHATLTRYANPINATFEQAKARVEPLLPVDCVVSEAILQEEYELDRMRVRETFAFGG